MRAEVKDLWVGALRSGEYKQGHIQLRNEKNEFCCLGVLCNIHAQHFPEMASIEYDPESYMGCFTSLPEPVCKWADLSWDVEAILMTMNDGQEMDFKYISDFIETYL